MLTILSLFFERDRKRNFSLSIFFSNTKIYIFIHGGHDFALFFVFLQKFSQQFTFYLWQKN